MLNSQIENLQREQNYDIETKPIVSKSALLMQIPLLCVVVFFKWI